MSRTVKPFGTLRLSRRELLTTLFGVTVTQKAVVAAPDMDSGQPGGFSVVLPCTQTQTEEVDGGFTLGKQLYLVVNDGTLVECMKPLVNSDVRVTITKA